MLRKRQKGQGLTEFALVLPLLLLLMLGVVEASRIIWAAITVQTAAREATRYATTGRPYVARAQLDDGTANPDCWLREGTPGTSEPWICAPEERVKAIQEVALERGRTLAVSEECPGTGGRFELCKTVPGAFGVQVEGQVIEDPVDGIKSLKNNAGEQGLNVTVRTYYNVEMIDPVFDFIMGGNFITLNGEVQMQNEGLDETLGAVPPPPIPTPPITDTLPTGPGSGFVVESLSGTSVQQNDNLRVRLLNHTAGLTYSVGLRNTSLGNFVICPPSQSQETPANSDLNQIPVAADGTAIVECRVSGIIPPGDYVLYSTAYSSTIELDTWENLVTVIAGQTPIIDVVGGDVWAINSNIKIELLNHQVPDQPFDVYFDYGGSDEIKLTSSPVNVDSPPVELAWKIPDLAGKCPAGGDPCTLQSRRTSSATGDDPYAITQIYINDPKIVIEQGQKVFAQGETLYFFLTGHTPNTTYDLYVGPADNSFTPIKQTVTTDGVGNYTSRIAVPIPEGATGWPNGDYLIASYPVDDSTNQIATEDFQIDTPLGPYITVAGGYTWPIGSILSIKTHQHQPNTEHYMQFGNNSFGFDRVTTSGGNPVFSPNDVGTATLNHTIPLSAAVGGPETHFIETYINSNNTFVADRQITVVPVPIIEILEGNTALPDATITIRISNHSPNSSYSIYYGKDVNDPNGSGAFLFSFITDANGQAERKYDLDNLPITFRPQPDCVNPQTLAYCFGTPYHMYSQSITGDRLAFTTLTLDTADLAITRVQAPSKVEINTTIPITVTVANLKAVTVSRYFDIDLYLNPKPLEPTFRNGQIVFPGDVKLWRNSVPPNGQPGYTFTVTHDFFVGEYGEQKMFGYADTSNFIKFENSETNNLNNTLFNVVCTPTTITNTFTSAAALNGWSSKTFGNSTDADAPQVTGGALRLRSDGQSTAGTNDDASGRGHFLFYLTNPVTSTGGLDVSVMMLEAPTGADFAKGGLSIRDSVGDPRSMKIEFNLAWNPNQSNHRLQVALRNSYGGNAGTWEANQSVNLGTQGPVWLRITRDGGSNNFNFYYATGTSTPPATWTFYTSATVSMADQLYLGLFNASYSNNNLRVSRFDNFSYTDPSSCPEPQGLPDEEVPPGLAVCTDLLEETSFELAPPQKWFLPPQENVSLFNDPGAPSGISTLRAPTFEGSFNNPFFYQQFIMPAWVISTTSEFSLKLYRDVDALGTDEATDEFYVVVATSPNPATRVTTPTLIAQGIKTNDWESRSFTLTPLPTVNMEDYAGQPLYAYFYNNSNARDNCFGGGTCHTSQFFFDNVQLTNCNTQPPPSPITTLIKGRLTLNRPGGTTERIPGVKVWAYSEGGELYETFTVQNGEFSFYNLPATASGIEYFIYAEHNVVDSSDSTQIETLTASTKVLLRSTNTAATPLTVNLDLFVLPKNPN